MAAEKRLSALDGLRAIAVAQVVICHYFLFPHRPHPTVERIMTLIDGVTVFFALSGYLIGGILFSAKGRAGLVKVFYLRRLFRIVPLYLLLIASYVLVRLLDNHFRWGLIYFWSSDIPLWSYLTFSQNIWMVHERASAWLLVTWSLAIEQQFYLIVPWLVRFLPSGGLLVLALAALVCAAFRPMPGSYLLLDRMDALAAGLILAILAHEPRPRAWLQRNRRGLRWLFGLFFAVFVVEHVAELLPAFLFAGRWITSLAYALLVHLLADEEPWPFVKPAIAWLAPLGLLSYCIYLFHWPFLFLTQVFIGPSKLLALLFTVGFAAVSYRYFERPLIEYGRRFRYGDRGNATGSGGAPEAQAVG